MRMRETIAAAMMIGVMTATIGAQAAPLGLDTTTPLLTADDAVVDFLTFGSDGDLSTFGAEITTFDGLTPNGFTELSFGVGVSLGDPTTGLAGGFDIIDAGGLFLIGDIVALGFADDLIEFQFGNLSGPGAGAFGDTVLASINFVDPLGPDPFANLVDGAFYQASITLANVVAVPEPAALALLLAGLGGLSVCRAAGGRRGIVG